ncbi:MAG TPA: hypothetical protein VLL25_07185, partial [Acidimicrobiales bacterium]|nr:hypothetical protein [Acidimicrobiales bacterium]
MGEYNPDLPFVMGEEWVGIREEGLVFSRAANTVEQGHSFTLAAPVQLGSASFYVNTFPQGFANGQAMMAAIYAKGTENQTGPIRSVVLPCTAGTLSGAASKDALSATVQQALESPSQGQVSYASAGTGLGKYYFDPTLYLQQLIGKRILGVNLLYAVRALDASAYANGGLTFNLQDSAGTDSFFYGFLVGEVGSTPLEVHRAPMGEMNPYWNDVTTVVSWECLPWTVQQMQRMVSTATHPIVVTLSGGGSTSADIVLQYLALEVLYCEELRLVYGGARYDTYGISPFAAAPQSNPFNMGSNVLTMR